MSFPNQQNLIGGAIPTYLVNPAQPINPYSGGMDYAGRWNVVLFGADPTGAAESRPAFQAAIDACNAAGGGIVYVPKGNYRITNSVSLRPKSNVVLLGAGMGISVLTVVEVGGGGDAISNALTASTWSELINFEMSSLTILGNALANPTQGVQVLRISGSAIRLFYVEVKYPRYFGMIITYSDDVVVQSCRVYRTIGDGIAVWNTPNAKIINNQITGSNDDSISAHIANDAPTPARSGLLIQGNTIIESQGIAVLGAKAALITDNILRRIMTTGVRVTRFTGDLQGNTPQVTIGVKNNLIQDVWLRPEPNPRNQLQSYIYVLGGERFPGTAGSPPGEPTLTTGAVPSLFGTATGTLYGNPVGGAVPSPAALWLDIAGNHLERTLPAVSAISLWGYDPAGIWVGNNGTPGAGFYNGAISDAQLSSPGVQLGPAIARSRVVGNTIETRSTAILFRLTNPVTIDGDYAGVEIADNALFSFGATGITGPATATKQRIDIRRNRFDGDPMLLSSGRTSGPSTGAWTGATAVTGVDLPGFSGVTLDGNDFRNVSRPWNLAADAITARTILRGNFAAAGFSASNIGVGTLPTDADILPIFEESDPRTGEAFGDRLGGATLAAASIPTSGRYIPGQRVNNTNPVPSGGRVLLGWIRLTFGTGHVAGTDWYLWYADEAL